MLIQKHPERIAEDGKVTVFDLLVASGVFSVTRVLTRMEEQPPNTSFCDEKCTWGTYQGVFTLSELEEKYAYFMFPLSGDFPHDVYPFFENIPNKGGHSQFIFDNGLRGDCLGPSREMCFFSSLLGVCGSFIWYDCKLKQFWKIDRNYEHQMFIVDVDNCVGAMDGVVSHSVLGVTAGDPGRARFQVEVVKEGKDSADDAIVELTHRIADAMKGSGPFSFEFNGRPTHAMRAEIIHVVTNDVALSERLERRKEPEVDVIKPEEVKELEALWTTPFGDRVKPVMSKRILSPVWITTIGKFPMPPPNMLNPISECGEYYTDD
jgi:hypothetical protein